MSCFFVYTSTKYAGSVGIEHVTSLDGKTYTIGDYTYNGDTYRTIDLTTSQYQRSQILVYGVDNSNNKIKHIVIP